jgi:hypothetical protein
MATIMPIIIEVIELLRKLNTFTGVNFFCRWREYYRFQINCTFLPKSEIFYTADEKNLGVR